MNAEKTSTWSHFRDELAAIQSIIPGLGHVYKGYYGIGVFLFVLGPMTIWMGLILGFATIGMGFILPVLYIGFVAYDAYRRKDLRKHPLEVL